MSSLRQRKYVPHLPSMQAICDSNYARFLRLLPDCDTRDLTYRFDINASLSYQIQILDSSRYTSTVEIAQLCGNTPNYLKPVMQVRLYHDAKMAEVISSQRVSGLKPSYQYPNQQMHQPNEKAMVNQFLAEWLIFCVTQQQHCQA